MSKLSFSESKKLLKNFTASKWIQPYFLSELQSLCFFVILPLYFKFHGLILTTNSNGEKPPNFPFGFLINVRVLDLLSNV